MSFYLIGNRYYAFTPGGLRQVLTTTGGGSTYPPVQTGRLWAGVGANADYDREHLLMDVMKSCRPWIGHLPGSFGGGDSYIAAVQDSNGYPTSIPPELESIGTVLLVEQADEMGALLNGRYRFLYEGSGTIEISGVSNISSSPGMIEFDYVANEGSLVDIRLTSIASGNHPRNMRLFKTTYADRIAAGYLIRPDYEWATVGCLRFMTIQQTNDNTITSWASRPKLTDYSWNLNGIPVEALIQVANEMGINPWVNIPHLATDDYVTQFATYCRDHLNPALKLSVEWSNEVWNFQFPQSAYCIAQAEALFEDGGGTGWVEYGAGRASQCMDLFATVFSGQMNRLRRVLGVQTGWIGLEDAMLNAPRWVALGHPAPHLSFDAYAVTGYFDGNLNHGDGAQALLDVLAEDGYTAAVAYANSQVLGPSTIPGSIANLVEIFQYHRNICNTYDLELIMYEGGTHIVPIGDMQGNETLANFMVQFNYTTEMANIYSVLLSEWDEIGDAPFMQFVTIARPSQYGSWGALRYPGDSNPRADVLYAYNEGDVVEPTVPNAFVSGNWTLTGGEGSLVLNITALPANGGSAITALQYRIGTGSPVNLTGTGTGSRTLTLSAGTYNIQIRAVNSVGASAWSDTKSAESTSTGGLTPVSFGARIAVSGHSIPNNMFASPWKEVIVSKGATASMISSCGPYATAKIRWDEDPAGPDRVRSLLQAGSSSSRDLFLGIEAHGGEYNSPPRASVQTHVTWSDAKGYALMWHNLAASKGAATFYANFWRDDPALAFGSTWRNSHNIIVDPTEDNMTELQLWDSIIDYVNANRNPGTPVMRLVPWLQVFLAVYDGIQAGTVTGITMSELFIDNVHAGIIGRWLQMATVMAVMYQRHPDELSNTWPLEFGGSEGISSGLAAQLRPIVWNTCRSLSRTGLP